MGSKWVSAITLSGMLIAHTTAAIAEEQDCKVINDRSTLDTFMQGVPGVGAFIMLVAPAEVRWAKMAAALGLSGAVWSAAKSYFGNESVVVCKRPPPPSQSAAPWQLYLGPQPGLVQPLYEQNALSKYLQSAAGQDLERERIIKWHDPCAGLNPPSFCATLSTISPPSTTVAALAQDQVWDISWFLNDVQYSAKLTVTTTNISGQFNGYIVVSFMNNGKRMRVWENADISLMGDQVFIRCSNEKFLEGNGVYDADTFGFTMSSRTEGHGTVKDAKVSGSATFRLS